MNMRPTDETKQEGRRAYRNGLSMSDCPYHRGKRPTFWRAWRRGWRQEKEKHVTAMVSAAADFTEEEPE